MRRVIGGLLVGVLVGGAVFWFTRSQAVPTVAAPAEAPAPAASTEAEPPESALVYASPQQPGLVVRVRRGAAPEVQVRVELARATRSVALARVEWLSVATERTDEAGRALFPIVAGAYLARATAADGASALQHFDVPEAAQPTLVELSLEAPVPVGGRVIDAETKQPVPQASIVFEPIDALDEDVAPPGSAEVRADSLGRFASAVPRGKWRLRATAAGYGEDLLGITPPAEGITLELPPASTLTGRVVDAAGKPVSGALVRAGPASVGAVRVEDDGRFSLTAPPGPVSLYALAPDGRQGRQRVTLPPAPGRLDVTVTVAEGAVLAGQVKDAAGRGAARAEVLVLAEPDDVEVARMEANAEGRFEARNVPAGRYSVAARRGAGSRASVTGVEIPQAPPVELVLSEAGRLTGVVTDTTGQPIAFAFVSVDWNSRLNEVRRSTRTDPSGRFTLEDLPAAEASVQARVNDEFSETKVAYVAAGKTAEVNLSVGQQARLVVLVANPKVKRVSVSSTSGGSGFRQAGEVVSGRFEALVPAGTYRVFGSEPAADGTFVAIENDSVTVKAGEVTTMTLADPNAASRPPTAADPRMHPELGSGLSFENVAGGVRIDFLMGDCPAAMAGARVGDLVISIDGAPLRDAREAFERVKKPAGQELVIVVRRDAQDVTLTVR